MTAPAAPRRGSALVRALVMVAAIALTVAGVWLIVLSGSVKGMSFGIISGLWGFSLGAWVLHESRWLQVPAASESSSGPVNGGGEVALRGRFEVELEREAAHRREYELQLEVMLRREMERVLREELGSVRGDVTALRSEVSALRGEVVDAVDGRLRLERVETTRIIGSDLAALQSEVRRLNLDRGPSVPLGNGDEPLAVLSAGETPFPASSIVTPSAAPVLAQSAQRGAELWTPRSPSDLAPPLSALDTGVFSRPLFDEDRGGAGQRVDAGVSEVAPEPIARPASPPAGDPSALAVPAPGIVAEPVAEPVPNPESVPNPEPEPVLESAPNFEPEPVLESEPNPGSEPVHEPEPVLESAPGVDPAPERGSTPSDTRTGSPGAPVRRAEADPFAGLPRLSSFRVEDVLPSKPEATRASTVDHPRTVTETETETAGMRKTAGEARSETYLPTASAGDGRYLGRRRRDFDGENAATSAPAEVPADDAAGVAPNRAATSHPNAATNHEPATTPSPADAGQHVGRRRRDA